MKFKCPPQYASGSQTPFDNLVGFQLIDGGGFTQANFEFTSSLSEKVNRDFSIGSFSEPISLENLNLNSINEARIIFTKNYGVYPNLDLSEVTNFTLYGSLVKRLESSVRKIINYFPAALEIISVTPQYLTGLTAYNIVHNQVENETVFTVNCSQIRNSFLIDYTTNSTRNIEARDFPISYLRDLTKEFEKYSLFYNDNEYALLDFTPSISLNTGELSFVVKGNPFSGLTFSNTDFIIKPNSYYTELSFNQFFDNVEKYLLNRNNSTLYSTTFKIPKQSDNGQIYIDNVEITWPIRYIWNIDIESSNFTNYLNKLSTIGGELDGFKTNLISRFLVSDSLKEFDTDSRKIESILQIYGRSFDEVKQFIDGLAHINSVNYNIGNDIPSQLLKNLSSTLGWQTNISPISDDTFLSSIFSFGDTLQYPGMSVNRTPDELNYQFYRNIILNSSYLFKSKGTRRSIEFLLRMIGAPDFLVEFNEYIYLAEQRININQFNEQYIQLSGGTFTQNIPQLITGDTYSIYNIQYVNSIVTTATENINVSIDDYPIDINGYPKIPLNTHDFFFQKGAGWYEQTPQHRSPEEVNLISSVFTGNSPNIQTNLSPFTYGEKYLSRFRDFPYMNIGFNLIKTIDNRKSWLSDQAGLRESFNGNYNSYYYTENEKLILNVKNIDLFLNPSQGLIYDVWKMSQNYDYPIPNTGLTNPYPVIGGIDWTNINPKPKKRTFFEFAQIFWLNMINVRNRMYITDGKTGGYPTLSSIFWKYLETKNTTCIPFDDFTYQKLIDYVEYIGDYWIRFVEQMVPATTLWNTGVKYENSIFNRQKFVYRRQRGCQIIPVLCTPCIAEDNLFEYTCNYGLFSCPILPSNPNGSLMTFNQILYNTLISYLDGENIDITECLINTLVSEWYINLKINDSTLINTVFFTGFGPNQVPSLDQWINALLNNLDTLNNYGYYGYIDGSELFVRTLTCVFSIRDINLELNIGIDLKINCNS